MSLARMLDNWMLGLCTKFAHWFQRLTGRTNYFIAKIGLIIATFTVTLDVMNYFHPVTSHKVSLPLTILGAIILLSIPFDAMALDKADEHSQLSKEKVGFRRLTNRSTFIIRFLWLYFSTFDTIRAVATFKPTLMGFVETAYIVCMSYGFLIFYYFIAVEPLPPQKSKVRQWAEKFSFGLLSPAPAEAKN